jgi:hypothetical protein
MKKVLLAFLLIITTNILAQDTSKYPKGFVPVKTLSELNGNWKSNDDLLRLILVQKPFSLMMV